MKIPDDIQSAHDAGRIPSNISLEYLAESKDRPAKIAIIFMVVFTAFILLLRLYARLLVVKKCGLDDALAILTMFIYIPFTVLSIVLINLGSGRHIEYIQYVLTMPTVRHTEVLDFVAHILYTTALFICRLSGVAFYQRVAVKPSALHKIILCSYPFLIAAFAVQFFLLLFHCIPVTGMWPYEWQHEPKDYKCLAWGVVYLTNSGLSLVCDMLVFVIPGVLIHQLHTTVERKLQLTLVMFPGVLVLVISAVRVWLVDIGQFDVDQSWQYNPMLGVENAEIAGTLIALSVPGLKPLLGVLYREVSSSVANTMGNGRPGKGGGTSMAKSYMRHRPRTEDEWKILGGHNDQFEMVVSEANVSCDNSEYTWPSHGGGVGVSNIRITDEVHVASETPDSSHELRHSRSTRKESV